MSEHTPTPWFPNLKPLSPPEFPEPHLRGYSSDNHENVPVYGFALSSSDEAKANAAFIVKAVNNHDALVQALQALVDNVNDYESMNNLAPTPPRTECWDTVAHAKRVLSAVGEAPKRGDGDK